VIDDNAGARDILTRFLEPEGFTVVTATNGQDALRQLRSEPLPNLILLDLVMPIMTGMEFLAERQRDPSLAAIPVVVLSGVSDFEREAAKFGVAAYLEKPLDPDDLVEKVLEMIKDY
jgi:CheY-like chemotaxis protein